MRDIPRCRAVILSWSLCLLGCGTGGAGGRAPSAGLSAAEPPPSGSAETAAAGGAAPAAEMRTIAGEVTAVTGDVTGVVAAIRVHAAEVGGTIAREDVSGDAQHRQATAVLRLPPAATSAFIDWLGRRAAIETSHVEDNDVTRQFFDRDVAIRNLEVTLERLRDLARQPDGKLSDVLEIEHEMTRVRGELERLRGAQRLLADQAARATLTISITMSPDEHPQPALKFTIVPHATRLHLVDAGGRAADRTGGGVTLMFSRAASFDFEVLAARGGDPRCYLYTFATGLYSDFLGGGRRRFFNPYLGVRGGGAKMNGLGAIAYGAEVGVELVRTRMFLVEVSGRAIGLWYNRDNPPNNDVLLEGTLGVGIPF
jgi:hypothetical protein